MILNIPQNESILDHPLQSYLPPASFYNNLFTITRFRRTAFDISVNLKIIYFVNDVYVYSEGPGAESVFSYVLKIFGSVEITKQNFRSKLFDYFYF